MSQITTHILDVSRGQPAVDVAITLYQQRDVDWTIIGSGRTNTDGRIVDLIKSDITLAAGIYRIHFDTASYFTMVGDPVFYPWADVVFNISADGQHYHIPLLLSPFGHSTYRGS